jgi:tetratricopeptide (TPR) repeat protein/mono/diheme cytochrome c family protein
VIAAALLLVALSVFRPSIAAAAQPEDTPTFNDDIAPIVFSRCATCHRPDGPAPFDLLSYAAVRRHATQIAHVTRSRLMPPWKADPGFGGPFVGQQPLTDDEINRIGRWVDAGAPEGDAVVRPPARWKSGWQLGEPDQVITFPAPYLLPPEGTDVLRIFVLPIPLEARRFVTGFEFRPGNPDVVHHANIRIDRTSRSRELDAEDPRPGYDGLMANTAQYPDGHFLGWTPGQVAPLLPKGMAWVLDPGTDLVVELHLQPTGRTEAVSPSFALYYTKDAPQRTPAILRLGREDIDIPAGDHAYTVTDSYTLPVDVELHTLQPHAHYRGRRIEGVAILPDGTTTPLIRISDWDFRWQHVFRLVTPIVLPRGTTLSMRFLYDNSDANPRNPRRPAERALWGQRSSDEMGNLWIQVLPANDRDLAALTASFRPKAAADDAAGYEMMLRRDPQNVSLHNDAALLYLELSQPERAIAHFAAVARLRGDSAPAHFNLGTALLNGGRLDEAIGHLKRAVDLNHQYIAARINLANTLASLGRLAEAEGECREGLSLDPRNAVLVNNLGQIVLLRGRRAEAVQQFRRAASLDSRYAEPHYNLGRAAVDAGNLIDAAQELRRAVLLKPDWPDPQLELAVLLSAASDERVLDPRAAVQLAERAASLVGRDEVRSLDVLGMAYAAAGRFDRALESATLALKIAPAGTDTSGLRTRAEAYRHHRRYEIGR